MKTFDCHHEDDLYRLKVASGLDQVVVHTKRLKYRGLLRHALKYGVWALRPNGTLIVRDSGPLSFDRRPYSVPFSFVRQQVVVALSDIAEVVTIDDEACTLTMRRSAHYLPEGWTAGIIFSGAAGELPTLTRCLDALKKQPELSPERGGQIIVCGPSGGGIQFTDPAIEYIETDTPAARALTALKKNTIIAASRNPRVAVMHARICLEPGALAACPREFDVATPRIQFQESGRRSPYIDYVFTDGPGCDVVPRGLPPTEDYDRARYLRHLKRFNPYIDGGVFFVRRELGLRVPLSNTLAWGEAEDVEWCVRLAASGALIDLLPDSSALTQSYKLNPKLKNGSSLNRAARPVLRYLRQVLLAAKHHYEMATNGR